MKINLHPLLPELKKQVLKIAQIDHIMAADCYLLAQKITAKTHKTISQTTLKRIYGFAQSRYAVSNFTLNVLAQYCGYESWHSFTHEIDINTQKQGKNLAWHSIAHSAHLITSFTLQTNKLTSGIPYSQTIPRQSIHQHMADFLNTEATGCVISAPYGMGKTIGITQWLDQQFADQQTKETGSIFLYVSSFSLTFAARYGFQMSHWFANLLNLSNYQIFEDFLVQYKNNAPGNFFLIIDDFNTNLMNKRLFEAIFKQLIDLSTHLSHYSWIKMVILTRPCTWQKYGSLIEGYPMINRFWFTDFSSLNHSNATNLPPFTSSEIKRLFNQVGFYYTDQLHSAEVQRAILSNPLLFQHYYQLKKDTAGPHKIEANDIFSTLSLYIKNQVLKGIRSDEKLFFLTQLILNATIEGTMVYINKKTVIHLIKENRALYNDLLHTGIIYEYQCYQTHRLTYQIRFQSAYAALYFLAQAMIDEPHRKTNQNLFGHLQQRHLPEMAKNILLNWISLFVRESADQEIFLPDLYLSFANMHLIQQKHYST